MLFFNIEVWYVVPILNGAILCLFQIYRMIPSHSDQAGAADKVQPGVWHVSSLYWEGGAAGRGAGQPQPRPGHRLQQCPQVSEKVDIKPSNWRFFWFRTVLKILIPGWSRLTECHRKYLSVRQIEFRKRKTYRLVDMLILCSKMKHSSWHLHSRFQFSSFP